MTTRELEKYSSLKRGIKILEEEIQEFENLYIPSKEYFEKGRNSVFLPSSSVEKHFRILEEKRDILCKKRLAAMVQLTLIEEWIDTLEDKMIQNIIKTRYILGYSWEKVARVCYGHNTSSDAPRKTIERYMNRCV